MFESIGKQSVEQLTSALPGVEKTITDAVSGLQVLVNKTLVPILADAMTEALARVDALDGAKVTVTPSGKLTATINISVDIPSFTAAVSMPLKPSTFVAAPEGEQ